MSKVFLSGVAGCIRKPGKPVPQGRSTEFAARPLHVPSSSPRRRALFSFCVLRGPYRVRRRLEGRVGPVRPRLLDDIARLMTIHLFAPACSQFLAPPPPPPPLPEVCLKQHVTFGPRAGRSRLFSWSAPRAFSTTLVPFQKILRHFPSLENRRASFSAVSRQDHFLRDCGQRGNTVKLRLSVDLERRAYVKV